MNLNGIVGGYVRAVSPAIPATLQASAGSTKNADYSRTPKFTAYPVTVDVQALTARQIEHMDAMNIQGVTRAAYFNGIIQGLNRPAGLGGDLLVFPPTAPGLLSGTTWLCVEVMEAWDASGWVKVAIQLQNGS